MKVIILGCGTASGTPRIGDDWGNCDPEEPRNRRMRASILVETQGKNILIDTSPDLRAQALDNRITDIDGVLFTHAHADHSSGIDDLRFFAQRKEQGATIPVHAARDTLGTLQMRFGYLFSQGPDRFYSPVLSARVIEGPFDIAGVPVVPFEQGHGNISTLGFRFGDFAYSTDVVELSEKAFSSLEGVAVWVVDCLQVEKHPTHAHLELVLSWISRIRPKRAILTHLSPSLDYSRLTKSVPPGVEVAYDGLSFNV